MLDRDFQAMLIDVPPVEDPILVEADAATIEEEDVVIGIVVNGEPRAYLRDAFHGNPYRHAVSDTIDSKSVAITHCDRIHCTRVFISPQENEKLDLRIGGWREDQTMELIVNDEGFSQKSEEIPLADLPFLELPWGHWRELFPDTLIYLGDSAGDPRNGALPAEAIEQPRQSAIQSALHPLA